MKIAAIADTHGESFEVPECDLLIHAGDCGVWGRHQEVVHFANQLQNMPQAKRILFVPGNHDGLFQKDPLWCRSIMPKHVSVLLDEMVEVDGIRFFGSPWTLPFGNWAFMADDQHLAIMYSRRLPENVDVLITHGPAYGILDGSQRGGSLALLSQVVNRHPGLQVNRHPLKKHIFGHIHEDGGKNDGFSYNVAATDLSYKMQRGCVEFEL